MSFIRTWGSTASERAESFPCDRYIEPPFETCYRAVDVAAPIDLTFRWLCQLRVAPYSYDWIDNLGRRSPERRDPENERMVAGERMMRIFRLLEFERDKHLTMTIDGTRAFGDVVCTYAVCPSALGSRIVVKFNYRLGRSSLMRWILPAGDLVMMRKQLLHLKELAEREASAAAQGGGTAVVQNV
jgi:hypothetical protein